MVDVSSDSKSAGLLTRAMRAEDRVAELEALLVEEQQARHAAGTKLAEVEAARALVANALELALRERDEIDRMRPPIEQIEEVQRELAQRMEELATFAKANTGIGCALMDKSCRVQELENDLADLAQVLGLERDAAIEDILAAAREKNAASAALDDEGLTP